MFKFTFMYRWIGAKTGNYELVVLSSERGGPGYFHAYVYLGDPPGQAVDRDRDREFRHLVTLNPKP